MKEKTNEKNERKNKVSNFFALKKVVQYNILTYWAYILSLQNDKKSRNRTKAKIAKWNLLASCTSQGELKLGSQIIKFCKYVKLLNSQLSMHITL